MPQSLSSEQNLEHFLTRISRDRDASASPQNQALNAILSFYKEVLGQTIDNVNALHSKRPLYGRHAPTVAKLNSSCKPLATWLLNHRFPFRPIHPPRKRETGPDRTNAPAFALLQRRIGSAGTQPERRLEPCTRQTGRSSSPRAVRFLVNKDMRF